MEVSATGAVDVWPQSGNVRRELPRLGLLAVALFAAVAAAVGYVGLILERRDKFSLFAPFSGWQLHVVEAVLALVVLGVGVSAAWMLVRRYRGLHGRTPHRRAAVMAALLPGLLLGGLAVIPMRAAFSWASDHTAAAASARHKYDTWLSDYHKAPPPAPAFSAAAPTALAARMLRPSDLGAHWYDGTRPNPTVAPVRNNATTIGEVAVARAIVTQQHWTGQSWSLDHFVFETQTQFVSAAAAKSYLKTWLHPTPSTSACCTATFSRTMMRKVGQAFVSQRDVTSTMGTRREAGFVLGNRFFMLSFDLKPDVRTGAKAFEPVLSAAVARAASTG